MTMQSSPILRGPDAAAYLGISKSTLEKWRVSGKGPRFLKIGARLVGYDQADLDVFRNSLVRLASTSGVARVRRRLAREAKASEIDQGEARPES
jgi:predicted DNA-binding transcriptional regulator AlpA